MSETAVAAAPKKRRKKESMFKQVFKRLSKNPAAMTGLIVLGIIIILAIIGPYIAPYDPNYMDYANMYATPNAQHWLGCDQLGRDLLSRLLCGGKYSLSLGIIAAMVGLILGTFFGCLVGYAGKTVDNVAMRICDIWSAIPGMLLAVLISTALGTGFFNTILAMTAGAIPGSIRNTRALVLKEREMEYLEAAKAMNCNLFEIIFQHMLPNIISFKIIGTCGNIGASIMQASGLSYIGLGVPTTIPEWGAMCASARNYFLDYPHMILIPGGVILITVLCFNLFGDGLRDAMDPRLKD
ncbi:MAG: ABC transporter permease [Lachnospiraceae bacterium]|nr:ABC transporter permease [Lachnospiraceae bacterium]